MMANSMTTINWLMLDDKKYAITVLELETALSSGQMQGLQIWDSFNP